MLFCWVNKLESELKMLGLQVKEMREELKELKDDGEYDYDSDLQVEALIDELKETRDSKKDSYSNWKVIIEAEEGRIRY